MASGSGDAGVHSASVRQSRGTAWAKDGARDAAVSEGGAAGGFWGGGRVGFFGGWGPELTGWKAGGFTERASQREIGKAHLSDQVTLFPLEFFLEGAPVSHQASARSKERWKATVKASAHSRVQETVDWSFLDNRPVAVTIFYFPP